MNKLKATKSTVHSSVGNFTNDSDVKLRKNSDGTKAKGDTNNNNNNNNNNSNSNSSSNHNGNNTSSSAKKSQFSISLNLKQKFCSIFRFKKSHQTSPIRASNVTSTSMLHNNDEEKKVNLSTRALPPLPALGRLKKLFLKSNFLNFSLKFLEGTKNYEPLNAQADKKSETMDFAANIEKVREVSD
jgi:hypothetical protein